MSDDITIPRDELNDTCHACLNDGTVTLAAVSSACPCTYRRPCDVMCPCSGGPL